MTRSIFLKNESYADVQTALAKADTDEERRHLLSERMKKNGWTKEREENFRRHCATIGFILPGSQPKANPLASDSNGRTQARLLSDALKSKRHDGQTNPSEVEE